MAEPTCAKKGPFPVELEPGDYWWCACGLSKSQPMCDGSHQGSEFEPQKITITEKNTYYLCGCKRSSDGAFCDGTHLKL